MLKLCEKIGEEEEENSIGVNKENTTPLNVRKKIDGILTLDSTTSKVEFIEKIDYSKIRVLLVEDDEALIKMAELILETMGIVRENLSIKNNGKEAIGVVLEHDFDIILMDRNMPIMGGDEASIEIKKLKACIPIIGISANHEGIENKFYDFFLRKPYKVKSFKEKIKEAILSKKKHLNK